MATQALIGISGWRYAPWRGEFYPPGLPERDELEVRGRAVPDDRAQRQLLLAAAARVLRALVRAGAADFVFAVKGSRYITHMLRLRGVETALANFFASGRAGARAQARPAALAAAADAEARRDGSSEFLELLPRTTKEAAKLARRHDERVKARAYLRVAPRPRAAPCARGAAPELRDTGAHRAAARARRRARRRRHGRPLAIARGRHEPTSSTFACTATSKLYESGYTDAALERWAERIRAWRDGRKPPSTKLAAPPPRRRSGATCMSISTTTSKCTPRTTP